MKDFDNLLLNIDNEMLKMKVEISKIDMTKIRAEINESISKVNFDQIKLNIDKAMKEVDFTKIDKAVKSALKEVKWTKVNEDVRNSLREAKKEIEKINMNQVKKEMDKARLEIQKSGDEIKNINIDRIMANAKETITKAKEELKLKKEMFNEMEKDGLLDQKEGFTIEYKDKNLFINGTKQSEPITDKYRKYIKDDAFRITISKE